MMYLTWMSLVDFLSFEAKLFISWVRSDLIYLVLHTMFVIRYANQVSTCSVKQKIPP